MKNLSEQLLDLLKETGTVSDLGVIPSEFIGRPMSVDFLKYLGLEGDLGREEILKQLDRQISLAKGTGKDYLITVKKDLEQWWSDVHGRDSKNSN